MKPRVMVVDDEKINRISLCAQMEDAGFEVAAFDSPFPALERLRREEWDVVVTDLRMPLLDGVSFLKEIRKIRPETEVLVMTAYGSVESAVEAMKSGAFDYVTKPYQWEEMEVRLRRMLSHRKVSQEVVRLRRELEDRDRFHGIVGNSPAMRKVFERIRGASDAVHPVLVVGETGTGKEMVADAIQRTGSRREAPYIKTSCSTLSREVIESELFGHEAGAFTGAVRQRRGRFELADGGTLLLDDIDDVPMDLQVKLLRVLQDGRFERVGGETTLSVDVRVVATAKARLEDLVAAGKFRQDLCYRLKVIEISLPPLRERREDLPLLTRHFLDEEARRSGSPRRDLSPDAMGALLSARWPGNVRELQHAIQHACALGTAGTIERLHLPLPVEEGAPGGSVVHLCLDGVSHLDLPGTVEEVEKRLTRWALAKCAGHQGRAAEMLGLPRTTFRERLARAESGPAQ